MARYIDADKLTDKLEELQFNAPVITPLMKIYNVIELVEDQPTADVVEVRHGEYIQKGAWHLECSVCGHILAHIGEAKNYCPYCGAKMDGKDIDVPTTDERRDA